MPMANIDREAGPFQADLRCRFSWLSSFFGLLVVAYFFLMTEPDLIAYYQVPEVIFDFEIKTSVVAIFFIFLIFDANRWGRDRARQKAHAERYREEVAELWHSRKQLQYKAHTYAGHADKLKLFISDKLLEYIEYDEKFLHFKSIAAEVRHNGVICFDKVQSALETNLTKLDEADPGRHQNIEALEQLRYLWDLLDLATADNIALHIANQLCDLEEQYYQQELNPEASENLLLQPDFSPTRALVRAVAPLLEDAGSFKAQVDGGLPCQWTEDNDFHIELGQCGSLLGNENHWVLLLENLLKNAQFFSGKRPYRHKYRRIAVSLHEQEGRARVSVFNGGPPISEADQEKVFQLGYSTRRVKEHHGKGLGLFFVGEIVKGYEGQIQIHNQVNQAQWISLRVTLDNGQVLTEMLEIIIEEEQPRIRREADSEPEKQCEWQYDRAVAEVEVSRAGKSEPHQFSLSDAKGQCTWLDPAQPGRPSWALEIHNKKRQGRLVFMPLDVRGVEFVIEVPLAETRLHGEDLDEERTGVDVDRLNEPFESFDAYHEAGNGQ